MSADQEWRWLITWDNAVPNRDSTKLLKRLQRLGVYREMTPRTTIVFAPTKKIGWRRMRKFLRRYLHPRDGNAAYVNLRSGRVFHLGVTTGYSWQEV